MNPLMAKMLSDRAAKEADRAQKFADAAREGRLPTRYAGTINGRPQLEQLGQGIREAKGLLSNAAMPVGGAIANKGGWLDVPPVTQTTQQVRRRNNKKGDCLVFQAAGTWPFLNNFNTMQASLAKLLRPETTKASILTIGYSDVGFQSDPTHTTIGVKVSWFEYSSVESIIAADLGDGPLMLSITSIINSFTPQQLDSLWAWVRDMIKKRGVVFLNGNFYAEQAGLSPTAEPQIVARFRGDGVPAYSPGLVYAPIFAEPKAAFRPGQELFIHLTEEPSDQTPAIFLYKLSDFTP